MACVSRASAEKRTGHAAIDATGFDRDQSSRHYANRTDYCIRALKLTALVDIETLYITDIHSTTSKKHNAKIGPQVVRVPAGDLRSLAADKGYDTKAFRDELRQNGIHPLIKHRLFNSLDHAHNVRMDSDRYHQRPISETIFSSIKRTFGSAVRARIWWPKFREMILKTAVYNLHRTVCYP